MKPGDYRIGISSACGRGGMFTVAVVPGGCGLVSRNVACMIIRTGCYIHFITAQLMTRLAKQRGSCLQVHFFNRDSSRQPFE
jgi:hypothetical protein